MHFAFLTEDSSGMRLLELLLPRLIGGFGEPHTWNLHPYKGIGRIPPGLSPRSDPSKRILLDHLPRLLRGYANTPGFDKVIVVLDADRRDCSELLAELKQVAVACNAEHLALFRLAIEETEAWYLGDREALLLAYPTAKRPLLDRYVQDAACETWERLADIVHPGGSQAIQKAGWPIVGQVKHEWASKIAPLMDPDRNRSPSFRKLRDGLRRLAGP
jgi:hypothetical protein